MLKLMSTVQAAKVRIVAFLRKVSSCLPRVSKVVDDVATDLEKN